MGKYRKIPVEIEAFQHLGDRFETQKWMKSGQCLCSRLKTRRYTRTVINSNT